jgi:hypothetical protein
MCYRDKGDDIMKRYRTSDHNVSLSRASDYISDVRFPETIKQGEEYISFNNPTLILTRRISRFKEFFSKPIGYTTKRIKVRFHWEGIDVVGSNMEEPNIFNLPLPTKKGLDNSIRWYLKTICKPDCPPGRKYLYISIDTFHENQISKFFLYATKYIATLILLGILITIPLVMIFQKELTVNSFLQIILNNKDIPSITTLSPVALLFVLLIIFWEKIDSAFESFSKRKIVELDLNTVAEGDKIFGKSIIVKKSSKS